MKYIKWFILLFLFVCLFSNVVSRPLQTGYLIVDVNNGMVDTIPMNRLSFYEETIEKIYLLGCIQIKTAGCIAENHSGIQKTDSLLLREGNPRSFYSERERKLIFNPTVSTHVESSFWGIYQCKKIKVKGLHVINLSGDEYSLMSSLISNNHNK